VVRRDPEAADAEGQDVRGEGVASEDTDSQERHERVHEDALVPAEVTRNETHHEAEVKASYRSHGRYDECCVPVVELPNDRLHHARPV